MRKNLVFVFCLVSVCQFTILASSGDNIPPTGGGYSRRVEGAERVETLKRLKRIQAVEKIDSIERIPGDTDQSRWTLVASKLQILCSAKRDDVYRILGISTRTIHNPDKAKVWTFRITDDIRRDTFTGGYFQLAISFEGKSVSAVQVSFIGHFVGPQISQIFF